MSFKPEPAIQSCYTGQQIHWFESCQLTWMSELNTDCIPWTSKLVSVIFHIRLHEGQTYVHTYGWTNVRTDDFGETKICWMHG